MQAVSCRLALLHMMVGIHTACQGGCVAAPAAQARYSSFDERAVDAILEQDRDAAELQPPDSSALGQDGQQQVCMH